MATIALPFYHTSEPSIMVFWKHLNLTHSHSYNSLSSAAVHSEPPKLPLEKHDWSQRPSWVPCDKYANMDTTELQRFKGKTYVRDKRCDNPGFEAIVAKFHPFVYSTSVPAQGTEWAYGEYGVLQWSRELTATEKSRALGLMCKIRHMASESKPSNEWFDLSGKKKLQAWRNHFKEAAATWGEQMGENLYQVEISQPSSRSERKWWKTTITEYIAEPQMQVFI